MSNRRPAQRRTTRRRTLRPRPRNPFDLLVESMAENYEVEDPALAELEVAEAIVPPPDESDVALADVLHAVLPELLMRPGRGALVMLLGIEALTEHRISRAAHIAAAGLVATGVDRPPWADELALPVTATGCVRLVEPSGGVSFLGADLHRGGRGHSVFLVVSHLDGTCAERVVVLPEAGLLPELLTAMIADAPTEFVREEITVREFRRRARQAIEGADGDYDEDPDEETGPGSAACALVLTAWLRKLAEA